MPAPLNVEQHWIKTFEENVRLLAQQKESRLRAYVTEEPMEGEVHFFDSYGQAEMARIESRFQSTGHTPIPHERRMVGADPYYFNEFVDPTDIRRILTDPTRRYTQVAAAASNRKIDDIIIKAFEDAVYLGKEGTGGTAVFDTSNVVAAATAGLTVAKLNTAARILDENEIEDEDRVIVVTPKALESLRNEEKATSYDYNTIRALVDGQIETFLGFKFVKCNRPLLRPSATSHYAYFWHKQGMGLAVAEEPHGRVDQRPDLNYATQVYLSLDMGAVRLEEARVGRIDLVVPEN